MRMKKMRMREELGQSRDESSRLVVETIIETSVNRPCPLSPGLCPFTTTTSAIVLQPIPSRAITQRYSSNTVHSEHIDNRHQPLLIYP